MLGPLCGFGSGKPKWRQIAASTVSSSTSSPSVMISSPTMTAGATGRSRAKYSSVRYSALGREFTSISISYLVPNLGIIFLKCFHGPPLGSFKKNRTFNMIGLLAGLNGSTRESADPRIHLRYDRFQSALCRMAAYHLFEFLFIDIAPLHKNIAIKHDCRRLRFPGFRTDRRVVFVAWLGDDLYLQFQLLPSLGVISVKWLQVLPLGSFRKIRSVDMIYLFSSFIAYYSFPSRRIFASRKSAPF